jgi:peptidyl-prolyl cis-trans isomerase C
VTIRINGAAVDTAAAASPELAAVRELLRQRAVAVGLLAADTTDEASVSAAIEQLLEREVRVPVPTEEECRRYYDAHPDEFHRGDLVFARHILFQVAPGVPVNDLRALAERTLAELRAEPDRFVERAQELSNCPSGPFGGNLGQIGRGDTVPEFETALFAAGATGILPGLVKTRYGFHIVAIDRRVESDAVPFAIVASQIAERLGAAVERRAMTQYVAILAGQAEIDGVDLAAAASPLVQ